MSFGRRITQQLEVVLLSRSIVSYGCRIVQVLAGIDWDNFRKNGLLSANSRKRW